MCALGHGSLGLIHTQALIGSAALTMFCMRRAQAPAATLTRSSCGQRQRTWLSGRAPRSALRSSRRLRAPRRGAQPPAPLRRPPPSGAALHRPWVCPRVLVGRERACIQQTGTPGGCTWIAGGRSAAGRAVCSVAYTPPACRGKPMPVSLATRLMQHSTTSYIGLCAPLQARAGRADSRPRCRRGRCARPA